MWRFPIRRLSSLVILFVGLSVLINIRVFSYRVYDPVEYEMLPPGYVIGSIWMVLIAIMAYSQYTVLQKTENGYIQWAIPTLFLYCILYPFYTGQFRDRTVSQYANIGSVLLSLYVSAWVYPISSTASAGIALTTAWSSYATWATFDSSLFNRVFS